MKKVVGYAFLVGMSLIALDVILYLVTGDAGALTVVGMATCFGCALIGGISQRAGKLEDYITMAVGLAFCGWLAFKTFT